VIEPVDIAAEVLAAEVLAVLAAEALETEVARALGSVGAVVQVERKLTMARVSGAGA
jgi:hypothetical protein